MDKYRKVKVVGKGNFGHAMLVQSNVDRKLYIMKIIDVSRMDRKQKEEALNEVHVLKAMRHPYIVTYRESFMNKRCLCIVMDYADGGDMYAKIAQQKKIGKGFSSEDQILDWFVQISLALKHVHDRKILHRDLKTQNIFLTSKGEVKMGDFGIARVLQHTYDCAQTAIGTPYYLSPEICQEKPYNQKSDIWSLGCILYEMLTLRHAFDANSMKGLVLKILRGTYPPIPQHYSEDCRNLVVETLRKEPSKRPSVRKILEKEFLSARISQLLSRTVARHEFAQVSIRKPKMVLQPSSVHSHTPISNVGGVSIEEGRTFSEHGKGEKTHSEREREHRDHRDFREREKNIGLHASHVRNKYTKEILEENKIIENKKHDFEEPTAERNDIILKRNMILHSDKMKEEKLKASHMHKKMYDEECKVSSTKQSYEGENIDCSESDEGYSVLINSLKSCLEIKKKPVALHDDDENFEEDESQRVYAWFLTPDGNRLPGISETDSITYRIEALRCYLEHNLTEDVFLKAYKYIQESNSDEDNPYLFKILGTQKKKYIPLIFQMIVCEDNYYLSS